MDSLIWIDSSENWSEANYFYLISMASWNHPPPLVLLALFSRQYGQFGFLINPLAIENHSLITLYFDKLWPDYEIPREAPNENKPHDLKILKRRVAGWWWWFSSDLLPTINFPRPRRRSIYLNLMTSKEKLVPLSPQAKKYWNLSLSLGRRRRRMNTGKWILQNTGFKERFRKKNFPRLQCLV